MPTILYIKTVLCSNQAYVNFIKPFYNLILVTIMGFTIAGIGAVKLGQTLAPPDNLFTRYLPLFPGQPINPVKALGFSCMSLENYYSAPKETHCLLVPDGSMFSEVFVIGTNGYVREIKFTFHDRTVRLGDLLTLFELPKHRSYSHVTFAFWHDFFVRVLPQRSEGLNPTYSYILTVTFTLTDR